MLMWVIKRFDTIEDKIEQCEKITQNEWEMYTKMKTITEYYQLMLQEDDLKNEQSGKTKNDENNSWV